MCHYAPVSRGGRYPATRFFGLQYLLDRYLTRRVSRENVEEARAQGSGDPVAVDGEAVLAVAVLGTGYPMDTGQEEVADDPALPGGLGVVRDVVLGAVFEAQYEAFIGTSGRQPFRCR